MLRFADGRLRIVFVVLLVALAGCGGGGGGATPTDESPADEPGETTPTPGDSTPTPDSETPDDSTPTPDSETPDGDTNPAAFDLQAHETGLQNAGSYTLRITTYGVTSSGGDIVGTSSSTITMKQIFSTDETLFDYGENFSVYRPPNSDTAYSHFGGEVQEMPAEQAYIFDFTNLSSGGDSSLNLTTEFAERTDPVEGSTSLGPASKYVVDSQDQLNEPVTSEYGEVTDFEYAIWVDKDTGVIAKMTFEQTVVQDGEEFVLESGIEITDLGSTTIEKPDWVPE